MNQSSDRVTASDPEARKEAVAQMQSWLQSNVEDRRSEVLDDPDESRVTYDYMAFVSTRDLLEFQFSDTFPDEWIREAQALIESNGVTMWSPASSKLKAAYERYVSAAVHDIDVGELSQAIVDRLANIEALLFDLEPPSELMGHNQPPDEATLNPISNDELSQLKEDISNAKSDAETASNSYAITRSAGRLRVWAEKLGGWLAKKGDLAIDELIKAGVKGSVFATVVTLLSSTAKDLFDLALAVAHNFH